MDLPIDETDPTDQGLGKDLLLAYQFWHKKRLLFNVLVGISGLISVIPLFPIAPLFTLFGSVVWAIVANCFYSTGYSLDSFIIVSSKGKNNHKAFREGIFWMGTISYVMVSYAFGTALYHNIFMDGDLFLF